MIFYRFILNLSSKLKYETYHCGCLCYVTSLSKNHVTILDKWSNLAEAIRYLTNIELSIKKQVIVESLSSMKVLSIGDTLYSSNTIVRAFEYFSVSRALYKRIRNDYQLPSVSTLQKLILKASKLNNDEFILHVFCKLTNRQRQCILIVDEVYVKASLTYRGGELFGKSVNQPDKLAKTILSVMIKCLFGGPTFIVCMIPVCCLDSDFQYEVVDSILGSISNANGSCVAIICDNNKVNVKFFSLFETLEEKPWLTKNNIFLLYDYVHIWKNIRNNWITEKTQEIQFKDDDDNLIARWSDLKNLYNLESKTLVTLSRLNTASIFPKPVERQNVSLCLRVFCDETLSALSTHPKIDQTNVKGTVVFLKMFIEAWKIINVHKLGDDKRLRDPLRSVINSTDDLRLQQILSLSQICEDMDCHNGKNRIKTLTVETSKAIVHTLKGLVELAKYLLSTSHEFVKLGDLTSGPIEKAFSKLRQGAGGAYFISVQQVLEKTNIEHSKLLLQYDSDFRELHVDHTCMNCQRELTQKESEIFDSLKILESNLTDSVKMALVYIAGYLQFKIGYEDLDTDTHSYCNEYGAYLLDLDRGGLTKPTDILSQFTFFCYILFIALDMTLPVCLHSLSYCFQSINNFFLVILRIISV